jgi:hypothetical protein
MRANSTSAQYVTLQLKNWLMMMYVKGSETCQSLAQQNGFGPTLSQCFVCCERLLKRMAQ